MSKRTSFCAALVLVFVAVVQCAQAEVRHQVQVADNPVLVRVLQLGIDVITDVDDGQERRTIDHPTGSIGADWLLLGPYPNARTVQLIVRAKQDARSEVDVESGTRVIFEEVSDAVVPYLSKVTEAGSAREPGDSERLYRAATAMNPGGQALQFFAPLMLAINLNRQFRMQEAIDAYESIDASGCGYEELCYLASFIYARALFDMDRAADAVTQYKKSLALFERFALADAVKETKGHILNGFAFANFVAGGGKDESVRLFDQALDIARELASERLLSSVHNNLGGFHGDDPATSLEHFERSYEYAKSYGDHRQQIRIIGNLTRLLRQVGEYDYARDLVLEVLPLVGSHESPQAAHIYSHLGTIYQDLGDYVRAEHFARLAQRIDAKAGREARVHLAGQHVGNALAARGDWSAASVVLEDAAAGLLQSPWQQRALEALTKLADVRLSLDEPSESSRLVRQVRLLATEQNIEVPWALTTTEAKLLARQGDTRAALEQLTIALASSRMDRPTARTIDAQALMARIAFEAASYEDAQLYGERALTMIETVGASLESIRLGPAWSSATYATYDLVAMAQLRAGQTESALATRERRRSYYLGRERNIQKISHTSPQASAGSRRLLRELALLARKRTSEQSNKELEAAYFVKLEEFDALREAEPVLELQSPDSYIDGGEDSQILDYVCGGDDCYVIEISGGQVGHHLLDSYSVIRDAAAHLRSQILRRKPARNAALRLAKMLRLDQAGPDTRHIVSSELIRDIPVEALLYLSGQQPSAISRVLSTRAQPENLQDSAFSYQLALFADPAFGEPKSAVAAAAGDFDTLRNWGDRLSKLPWSGVEADNIAQFFDESNVKVMRGSNASRAALLDESTRGARILHMATHGYFSEMTPDLAGVATAPDEGDYHYGFVSMSEFSAYPFASELVVISGCETGLGRYGGGEGVMSMARTFLGRGARHVVATLWKVSDRASAEFMAHFYRAMRVDGLAPAVALQKARVKMAESPGYRDPMHWAPYFLMSH